MENNYWEKLNEKLEWLIITVDEQELDTYSRSGFIEDVTEIISHIRKTKAGKELYKMSIKGWGKKRGKIEQYKVTDIINVLDEMDWFATEPLSLREEQKIRAWIEISRKMTKKPR